MVQTRKYRANQRGFTLVELMVAVFLTAIAVISIYRGYVAFYQSADAQQQVMEMQQNLRIGMSWLAEDIRRAGINEEDEDTAGFLYAGESEAEFSQDLSGGDTAGDDDDDGLTDEEDESRIGDGDTTDFGEQIKYTLVYDNPGTGAITQCPAAYDPAIYPCFLYREVWDPAAAGGAGGYVGHKIIDNVEALDFVYWDSGSASPPADPAPMTIAPGDENDPGVLEVISRVEITLVVRTTNQDYRFTDDEEYKNLRDATVFDAKSLTVEDDKHFRRRAFTMTVQIRNNI